MAGGCKHGRNAPYCEDCNPEVKIARLTAELAEQKDLFTGASNRLVNRIHDLEAEIAALREYVEIITDGGTDYPETWDELHRLGLIVEVKPTPEFTDEWGDDVAMWVLAWKAGGFEAIDAGKVE
jgi:hypothetical protein